LVATNPTNRRDVATAGAVPQSQVDGRRVGFMLDDSKALRKDWDIDKGNAETLRPWM
jgi:hypothetical protein